MQITSDIDDLFAGHEGGSLTEIAGFLEKEPSFSLSFTIPGNTFPDRAPTIECPKLDLDLVSNADGIFALVPQESAFSAVADSFALVPQQSAFSALADSIVNAGEAAERASIMNAGAGI